MIENLTNNKTVHKKKQNELCIDDLIINKELLSQILYDDRIIKSNILINSLQDFIKRCEVNYGKLFYEKNYLISLNEIFTLIHNSIFAQQQLDTYIYKSSNDKGNNNDSDYSHIKSLNDKFINDLNYNIFSIEKIKNKYYSFNNIKKKNFKNKKLYNPKLFSSPHNISNRINSIFNNIYSEVFMNGSDILNGNITSKELDTYNGSIKSARENLKSDRSNTNSLKHYTKPKNKNDINKDKKNKKVRNVLDNVSNVNKKRNCIRNDEMTFNENIDTSNLIDETKKISSFTNRDNQMKRNSILQMNKISKTSKSNKNIKCLDIYKVCQNLKKNKISNNVNSGQIARSNSSYYYLDKNEFNDSFLKKSFKSLGFSQVNGKKKINTGIKKIIVSNACKPSNFTNHLLNKGKKYINDFNKMDEENKKRKQ